MITKNTIVAIVFFSLLIPFLSAFVPQNQTGTIKEKTEVVLRKQILDEAAWALKQQPVTVTASHSPISAGGIHDFYSEGDYWWPNPVSADSPYIQKDGMTNPGNFTAHRLAMIRLSKIAGALASAYLLTHEKKYAEWLMKHCNAWFVNKQTLMNPSLLYAQAVKGHFTGRGIGIIDTIQLMEVAQALLVLENAGAIGHAALEPIKKWFTAYLDWLTTHPYGKTEMNGLNNHGTCWVMQVACFAKFTGNRELMRFCSDRYKQVLLPNQVASDGSLPRELKRTKPYGYSIFDLDALSMVCQILSTKENDLWHFTLNDGRTIKNAIDFLFPYVADKNQWPFPKDVMYWNDWPVAQPFLLFGANAFHAENWFAVWEKLDHNPQTEEIIRNLPVRHPLIWF
jgi:hypothetical protein